MASVDQANSAKTGMIPADGFKGLTQNWSQDLLSGFIVFLIALPLSIGIALASGAPATAGIITAIVGGLLGSLLGGSHLTINGPAAGLIVLVVGTITDLGQGDMALGFRKALATFALAGALQVAFGALRLGKLGTSVPGSVIHGMLTAIGAIIIVKQLPVALGVQLHSKEILEMMAELPRAFAHMNPEVAIVAAIGFIVIIAHNSFKGAYMRFIPAPLLVVLVGIAMAMMFDFGHEHMVKSHGLDFSVGPKQLLSLPQNLMNAFIFPDFSSVFSLTSLRWAVSLALVASIESLLSANAVDRMDPYGRNSQLDRELLSKGFCNIVSAMIGGIPMIAEMVRSSANVRNGGRTRLANFFHGAFLLTFLLAAPQLLQLIPLAALAAVLISVGYRLAHPSQFFHTAKIGRDHFAAFVTTFAVTLATDLLVGVAAGIAVELMFNFSRGVRLKDLFKVQFEEHEHAADGTTLVLTSPVTFTNFLSLKDRVEKLGAEMRHVIFDFTHARTIDHTSLDQLERIRGEFASLGRDVQISFSEAHKPVSKHPLAARRRKKAALAGAGAQPLGADEP